MLVALEIGFVWSVVTITLMVWLLDYYNEVPAHDESKRYQELRKRPEDPGYTVVRSFRYRHNALKWVNHCAPFRGSLRLYDSRTQKVLFDREMSHNGTG